MNKKNKKNLSWDEVEASVQKEMVWVLNTIETFNNKEAYDPISCRECLTRKIAILIVSGKIRVREITKKPPLESFWTDKKYKGRKMPEIFHGGDWHRDTMSKIENHFLYQKCEIVREPTLHWGRADLGVFKKGSKDLYIEVGTTSLFKLWLNLVMMKNWVYLIVPNDQKIVEFTIKE